MSELILWPSVGYVGYQNNTVGSEGDPAELGYDKSSKF